MLWAGVLIAQLAVFFHIFNLWDFRDAYMFIGYTEVFILIFDH